MTAVLPGRPSHRTNATVMDTRERLAAPVVLGVGPMGGANAGKWRRTVDGW